MRAADQIELLSLIDIAAVLLDSTGCVMNVNGEAAELMGSDLQLCNRRLVAADRPAMSACKG